MSHLREIKDSIKLIAQSNKELIFRAKVVSVEGNTCTVRYNNIIMSDVSLAADNAKSILIKPAVGSTVLVADVSNGEKRDLAILQYGAIESITINDGGMGGLVIGSKLIDWMNKVASDMQTLKTLLLNTPVAGNGAPLGIMFNPQTGQTAIDDFENKNIKHG